MFLIALISYNISLYELNDTKQQQITTEKLKENFEFRTKIHKLKWNINLY